MKYYPWFLYFFTLILLSSCVIDMNSLTRPMIAYPTQDRCNFNTDSSTGLPLKWPKNKFPIRFYVHTSVPDKAHENFYAAIVHWNDVWLTYLSEKRVPRSKQFLLFITDNPQKKYQGEQKNDGYNMLFFAEDFKDDQKQGITTTYYRPSSLNKSHLTDTDIVINNSDFDYHYDNQYNILLASYNQQKRSVASSAPLSPWLKIKQGFLLFFKKIFDRFKKGTKVRRKPAAIYRNIHRDKVDFPSLIIHELGHVPGLGHVKKDHFHEHKLQLASRSYKKKETIDSPHNSVMKVALPKGQVRRHIGDFDLNSLYCGYFLNQ